MQAHRGKKRRAPAKRVETGDVDAFMSAGRLDLARMVRGARAVLGWSQTELAIRSDISQPSIARIEQGIIDVRHSTVLSLRNLFGDQGLTFKADAGPGFTMLVDTRKL
jgi:ribosome-binding protein aMBF1 (putative translation factor)